MAPAAPAPGVYTPAVTFFDPETDTLRTAEQAKYYSYLANSGLTGLVILGTNAETFLLSREERASLVKLARESVPKGFPIIAGVSGHSTSQTLEFIDDAHKAGADYALVLPAAYFGKQTTPAVVKKFFSTVAKSSALPIVLYNFPGVTNGLDLDVDTVTDLVKAHDNIVGIKLTCGSVAKVTCLAASFPPERFAVFGGQTDFLLGGLASGSAGCIGAFGNVFPKSVVKVYQLWKEGKTQEALQLQRSVSLAENSTKGGIAITKYAASQYTAKAAGIEGDVEALLRPRQPYDEPSAAQKSKVVNGTKALNEIEKTL